MPELLFEIFSEEIPARMQEKASIDLFELIKKGFAKHGISFEGGEYHSTPRRITVVFEGISAMIDDVREEKRGPKIGAPDQALQGFVKANGISSIDDCEQIDGYYYLVTEKKGGATSDLLPEILEESIRSLVWPKSMTWGDTTFRWVRPMHSIVSVFDGKTIEWDFDLGGKSIKASNVTRGHRFLSPNDFTVKDFAEYETKLLENKVVLSREKRKELILEGAKKQAEKHKLKWIDDNSLLDEVCGLVEYPYVISGVFDKEFLNVPQEVLIASMRNHQKYFPLYDESGNLANRFVVVSNMPDKTGNISEGNGKVLRARLSDARFFWESDKKIKLEDNLPKLEQIVFHEKLGNVRERSERISKLAGIIAGDIGGDVKKASRAGILCKCDLVSGMVGEFPEVQGIMGRYYALEQNEDEKIAQAIATHYSPAGPNDAVPNDKVAICVALADKLDTLAGFFGVGIKPTGSKDPYALRRSVLGIVRILIENNLDCDVFEYLGQAIDLYPKEMLGNAKQALDEDLPAFVLDRLKHSLKNSELRHEVVESVISSASLNNAKSINPLSLYLRAKAIEEFIGGAEGENLLIAYRRAVNILEGEEKKDKKQYQEKSNISLLVTDEEKALYQELSKTEKNILTLTEKQDYAQALAETAKLRQPLDAFFDAVLVNDNNPDIRVNRLNLLSNVRSITQSIADFSKL